MCMLRFAFAVLLMCACLSRADAAALNDDLQDAAETGNVERVRTLINQGADVNAVGTSGKTPLMYAATRGHDAVLELLLQKGADVNAKAKATGLTPSWQSGWTALMYAANHGNCTAVHTLIAKGANADITADDGATVLMQATGCREEIMRAMSFTNAHTAAKGPNGATELITAAMGGDADVVRSLLDSGADVNAKTTEGGTALIAAAVMGHVEVIRVLLDRGADVNASNDGGHTALLLAIENASTAEAIRKLAAIAQPTNRGAFGGSAPPTSAIVQLLLDHGANVNATTNEGGTPLMYAAQNCDDSTVKLLLDKGAKVNVATSDGVSALAIVKAGGCGKVVKQLRNAGAK